MNGGSAGASRTVNWRHGCVCCRDGEIGDVQSFVIDLRIAVGVIGPQLDADLACGRDAPPGLADAERQGLPFIRLGSDGIADLDPHAGVPVVDGPCPDLGSCRGFEVDL